MDSSQRALQSTNPFKAFFHDFVFEFLTENRIFFKRIASVNIDQIVMCYIYQWIRLKELTN